MDNAFKIRPLKFEELYEAIKLVKQVFLKFEAHEYEQEGVDTFLSFIEIDVMQRHYNEKYLKYWACFDKDKIIGVISMKKESHVCMLFVEENYHRRGIAKALFKAAIVPLNDNPDYNKVTVNSSPYATAFYHKIGFNDTNKEMTVNGIRFTPMEYIL